MIYEHKWTNIQDGAHSTPQSSQTINHPLGGRLALTLSWSSSFRGILQSLWRSCYEIKLLGVSLEWRISDCGH